ncbi:MAG: hypothetical protein QM793_12320 [Muricomes sp.]
MKNLFKYMGMYWKVMIAILVVLIVQAYCDLSLPGYTSDIVNVGIQQGGIDKSIPGMRWRRMIYGKTAFFLLTARMQIQ